MRWQYSRQAIAVNSAADTAHAPMTPGRAVIAKAVGRHGPQPRYGGKFPRRRTVSGSSTGGMMPPEASSDAADRKKDRHPQPAAVADAVPQKEAKAAKNSPPANAAPTAGKSGRCRKPTSAGSDRRSPPAGRLHSRRKSRKPDCVPHSADAAAPAAMCPENSTPEAAPPTAPETRKG